MANHRGRFFFCASLTTLATALACASTQHEVDLPPQTLTEAPTSTAEQEAALATPERPAASEADPSAAEPSSATPSKPQPPAADSELSGRKQTVVIRSSGSSGVTPQTLQQATASERERRAAAEAPVAVITNQNLPDLAAGGQVTVIGAGDGASAGATPAAAPGASGGVVTATGATTAPPAAASGGAPPAASTANAAGASAPSAALAEEYWRGQALKIRLDWKAAVEAVDQLQSDVADLRRRFYEEDDPFYRDNEIKPAWDRALDRLQEAKADAEAQERKLTRFLEEGRKSGALPGWLREGLEFEPPPTADRSPAERRRSDDPWEPKVLEDEPRDP